MIIITDRAAELMGWIEANCASTTYTLEDEGRLFLNIGDDDAMIFELMWHGCFIYSEHSGTWRGNTPLNRMMINLITEQMMTNHHLRAILDAFESE